MQLLCRQFSNKNTHQSIFCRSRDKKIATRHPVRKLFVCARIEPHAFNGRLSITVGHHTAHITCISKAAHFKKQLSVQIVESIRTVAFRLHTVCFFLRTLHMLSCNLTSKFCLFRSRREKTVLTVTSLPPLKAYLFPVMFVFINKTKQLTAHSSHRYKGYKMRVSKVKSSSVHVVW